MAFPALLTNHSRVHQRWKRQFAQFHYSTALERLRQSRFPEAEEYKMERESQAVPSDDLIVKSRVREEYGLTEGQVRMLGEPDQVKPNPHYRKSGAPMQLFSRARVERWIEQNRTLLTANERRRKGAEKAVQTKREQTRKELAALLQGLKMHPAPSRTKLEADIGSFIFERHGHYPDEISEKAICSHLRHNYTNYEEILAAVKGRVGKIEFYYAVKALLCCRIVKRYSLKVDPLIAAFGYAEATPEWLRDGDPEVTARRILGMETDAVQDRSVDEGAPTERALEAR